MSGIAQAMSVKSPSEKSESVPSAAADAGEQAHGWLSALRARLGIPGAPTLRATLEAELKGAGDGHAFSTEEREMLLRILRFGALRVDDVMVPRADIIAVDENEPIRELLRTFDVAGVSRVPLFRESLDDPRGMVHVKDLLRWLYGDATGRAADSNGGPATEASEAGVERLGSIDSNAPGRLIVLRSIWREPTCRSRSPRPNCAVQQSMYRHRCRLRTCSFACSRPISTWPWSLTNMGAPTALSRSKT